MNKLNEYDIQFLTEKLQKGESIPEDYKYKLFPIIQKEQDSGNQSHRTESQTESQREWTIVFIILLIIIAIVIWKYGI